MNYKTLITFFLVFFYIPQSANGGNKEHKVFYKGNEISLDKKDKSLIHIINNEKKTSRTCQIYNWKLKYDKGGGLINITSDDKAVLVYFSNSFFFIDEALACHNGIVSLYKTPNPNG